MGARATSPSFAGRRALRTLLELERRRGSEGHFVDSGYRRMRHNTLEGLGRQGLVETRLRMPACRLQARLTALGRAWAVALEGAELAGVDPATIELELDSRPLLQEVDA